MDDILKLDLLAARTLLRSGSLSATELTLAHLARMAQVAPSHNLLITELAESALTAARQADQQNKDQDQAPLAGIPILHKDLFCTANVRTTAGSRILEQFTPPYSAHIVSLLEQAGAITLGKTNLDEFAMGSANITSAFGPVINPWRAHNEPDRAFVPGGSSGGSAAAIAAGLGLAATGTDTGGSIRQPAAFTGTFGIKPTYGRCSRWGIIAFASSLDQAGIFTRTVADGALMLRHMAGYDPRDSTSLDQPVDDYLDACQQSVRGLRIGIAREYHDKLPAEMAELTKKGQAWLAEQGAELVELSLRLTDSALPCYYVIAPAECSSNLARYDGVRYGLRVDASSLEELYGKTRAAGFGQEVQRRILTGTYVLSEGYYDAYYRKAQKVRTLIRQDFEQAFAKVDLLLTPTTPQAAFPLDSPPTDPIEMYENDRFTVPASLAGLPAASVPCGLSRNGLPLGLQLIAPSLQEARLFTAAAALERAAALPPLPVPMAGPAS